MDKEYLKKDYSGIVMGIMCLWLALFTFKYGQFLFLELLQYLFLYYYFLWVLVVLLSILIEGLLLI